MKRSKELARKSIHFLGLFYIPSLFYLDRTTLWFCVIALTAFAFLLEILRIKSKIDLKLVREYEKDKPAGYFYTGLAFSVITPLPTDACIVAACCAFGGDGVSGIVKRFERRLAIPSFVIASSTLSILFGVDPIPSIIAAFVTSLLDGRNPDDNFTIPITAAFVTLLISRLSV